MRLILAIALACATAPAARAADTLTTIDQTLSLPEPAASFVLQNASGPAARWMGGNASMIMQNGNNNSAVTDQMNSGNTTRLLQVGNSNSAVLNQYGSFGTINSVQTGAGIGLTVTQTGNAPSLTITQTRPAR